MVYKGEIAIQRNAKVTLSAEELLAKGIDPHKVAVDNKGEFFEEFFNKNSVPEQQVM